MNTILRHTLILFILLATVHSLAQSPATIPKKDSVLIDSLLTSAWTSMRVDPRTSLQVLKGVDSFILTRKGLYTSSVLLYYYGIAYKNLNQYDSSEWYMDKYIEWSLNHKAFKKLAPAYMAKANLYSDQNLYDKSMAAVTQSLRYYDELNDTLGIIIANGKMGYLLSETKRLTDANAYHTKALKLALEIKDTIEIATAYSNIGLVFEKQVLFDSALAYFKRSEHLSILQQDAYALAFDRYNIGNLLMKQNKLPEAGHYLTAAYTAAIESEVPGQIIANQLLLGTLYLRQNRTKEGIQLMEDILKKYPDEINLKDQVETFHSLQEAYQESGNLPKAIYYLQHWATLNDSLLNLDITRQVHQLELGYQTEQKEQAIQLLNATNALTQSNLKTARLQTFGLGIIVLIFSILLISIYRLLRKTRVQNVYIQKTLSEKETLIKEIHHRVKNNLQFISSLLNLQARQVEDEKTLSILKEGQNRVRSMALIHQNLYQEQNLTGIEIKKYFEVLIQSLFQSYNIAPGRIQLHTNIEPMQLDVDTMIPLGLIVNELISNALKYAFPGERQGIITVSLIEETGSLILLVADNGIGIQTEHQGQWGNSFGYRLIQAFKTQLDAKLSVESDQGTVVTLKINDYKKAS